MTNDHGCSLGISMAEGVVAAEILSRLPVKSLMRFRCVCKSWRGLTSDPYFIQKHLDRSRKKPQLVVMPFSVTGRIRNIGFYACTAPGLRARLLFELKRFSRVQETLEHAHHVDGLVLLDTRTGLHVCNPSTGEFLATPESDNVPVPPNGSRRAALGYVPRNKCYEVVRCFYRHRDFPQRTCSLGLEVFGLGGRDRRWRVVDPDPPYPIDTAASPASIGGAVYFVIDNGVHTLPPKGVLAFNLDDETFKAIDPPSSFSRLDYCGMSELEGELCFVRTSTEGQKMDVWAYRGEEEEGGPWVHAHSINLADPWADATLIEVSQGKLLLHMINYGSSRVHSLELYDPQTGLFQTAAATLEGLEIECSERPRHRRYSSTSFRVITYVESLASIKRVTFYDESLASIEGVTFYDGL